MGARSHDAFQEGRPEAFGGRSHSIRSADKSRAQLQSLPVNFSESSYYILGFWIGSQRRGSSYLEQTLEALSREEGHRI